MPIFYNPMSILPKLIYYRNEYITEMMGIGDPNLWPDEELFEFT